MNFNIADPHRDEKLSSIIPLSARAHSWLARVNSCIPEDQTIQLIGAVTMLEGLDYHYSRFMGLVDQLEHYFSLRGGGAIGASPDLSGMPVQQLFPTPSEMEHLNALDHESVAYLNRLGQFHSFAKNRGLESRISRACELMVFRNKHTAHRSIDAPKGESQDEIAYQAMAFGFYRLTRGGFPTYQIPSKKKHHEFALHRDHPVVMQEGIDALFSLFPSPSITESINQPESRQ